MVAEILPNYNSGTEEELEVDGQIQQLNGEAVYWVELESNPLAESINIANEILRTEQKLATLSDLLLSDNILTAEMRRILSSVYLALDQ